MLIFNRFARNFLVFWQRGKSITLMFKLFLLEFVKLLYIIILFSFVVSFIFVQVVMKKLVFQGLTKVPIGSYDYQNFVIISTLYIIISFGLIASVNFLVFKIKTKKL
jgi:hypothetical protein